MSDDALKKRGKALEEDFFQRQEREAIERLSKAKTDGPRLSPVTGKPMVSKVLHGVVIDQDPETGGIWLDAGELERLVEAMKTQHTTGLERFFSGIIGSFKSEE